MMGPWNEEMSETHERFLAALRQSEAAVEAVVQWLRAKGRDVEKLPIAYAPTAADHAAYADSGDARDNADGKLIEVKQISRPFTTRKTWPFREIFVSKARNVDKRRELVKAYVTVNPDLTHAAVLRCEDSDQWYLKETVDALTQRPFQVYAAPLELATFHLIKPEHLCACGAYGTRSVDGVNFSCYHCDQEGVT